MSMFRQLRLTKAIAPATVTLVAAILFFNCWYSTPARAQSESLSLILSAEGIPSFASLMQQAESQTGKLIQQKFNQKPRITEITITVVGDRNGQQVPLLYTKVSRVDWRSQPAIGRWTRYFHNSALLLGFSPSSNVAASSASRRSLVNVNTANRAIENDPAYRDD
jgi:hypothetical protein